MLSGRNHLPVRPSVDDGRDGCLEDRQSGPLSSAIQRTCPIISNIKTEISEDAPQEYFDVEGYLLPDGDARGFAQSRGVARPVGVWLS